MTAGVLKCPYNHHRVEQNFHSGSSRLTMKSTLIAMWEVKVAQLSEEKK